MSIDFPRAWQLAKASKPEEHHENCSYIVETGGFLCDCDFLNKHPDTLSSIFYGEDRRVIV